MDCSDSSTMFDPYAKTLDDLPDEVFEFILGFLPPYKDLQDCMCVSKKWYISSKNVMRKASSDLYRAISDFNIRWKNITPVDMAPSITKRFSHAACVHENSMYIFGGCTTNSTAFNDLWRFDLSKRQWIRPLTMGAYPTPKAYASLIRYRDSLILFGGWTYPSLSQYYQDWTMFNEIHFYNITSNRWILMSATNNPPPMAGHSAMIKDDNMIVFGGLYKPTVQSPLQCSNDVWILDLRTFTWRLQPTADPKPCPRYGQSLITLNENTIMIIGGVQALHNRCVYSDAWVLKMEGSIWLWYELTVKNKEWSAGNIWCHPAIKVGDKVVSLSRNRNGGQHPVTSAVRMATAEQRVDNALSQRMEQNSRRPLDRDNNVNGQRGSLPHRRANNAAPSKMVEVVIEAEAGPSNINLDDLTNRLNANNANDVKFEVNDEKKKLPETKDEAKQGTSYGSIATLPINRQLPKRPGKGGPGNKFSPSGAKIVRKLNDADKYKMAAFACDNNPPPPPPEHLNRRISMEHLAEIRQEFKVRHENAPTTPPLTKKLRRNTLAIHVLDISSVMNENNFSSVSWMCPKEQEMRGAPEEFIMYTLVQGKGELIMFGGVHNDVNLVNSYTKSPQYSNSLHFITAPKDVI